MLGVAPCRRQVAVSLQSIVDFSDQIDVDDLGNPSLGKQLESMPNLELKVR
jgi:hypothetical protein